MCFTFSDAWGRRDGEIVSAGTAWSQVGGTGSDAVGAGVGVDGKFCFEVGGSDLSSSVAEEALKEKKKEILKINESQRNLLILIHWNFSDMK